MNKCLSSLSKAIICFFFIFYFIADTKAQEHQFASWTAWMNNVKFNERWGMNNDIQFRSSSSWKQSSNLLVRAGINYFVNENQNASIGYAFTYTTNTIALEQDRLTENRIWEQYIINTRILGFSFQNRFRLEQRFLERNQETLFTQRARYFFRGIIPLQSSPSNFNRGLFASFQNEVFFNIQNNQFTNSKLFDQNRAYASVGFRFSRKYDLEIGYMNQVILRNFTQENMMNHIMQVAFYSKF